MLNSSKGKHYLLVLGNGFDLHCGLNSSFNHFVRKKIINGNVNLKNAYSFECITKKNIWYLLLLLAFYSIDNTGFPFAYDRNKNIRWMDVESFIATIVINDKNQANVILSTIEYALEQSRVIAPEYNAYRRSIFQMVIYNYVIKYNRNYSTIDPYVYLQNELFGFEKDFTEYLKTTISESKGYVSKAHEVLKAIKEDDLNDHINILSFNYTNPKFDDCDNVGFQSVHGQIDDENGVIIGIDQNGINNLNNNSKAIPFTKARRKMGIIAYADPLPNPDSIDEIAIFGHSLGKQDYSYFHSIFNYYDLLNSKKRLVVRFYYIDHAFKDEAKTIPDEEQNKKNYNEYVTSVFNLMNDYAKNAVDEKESKTVITRLLLERRILIEDLKSRLLK